MIYLLKIKKCDELCISRDYPFLPDDEFEEMLNLLIDGIENIPYVDNVKINNDTIKIQLKQLQNRNVLLDDMKPYFTEVFCYYRYISLENE